MVYEKTKTHLCFTNAKLFWVAPILSCKLGNADYLIWTVSNIISVRYNYWETRTFDNAIECFHVQLFIGGLESLSHCCFSVDVLNKLWSASCWCTSRSFACRGNCRIAHKKWVGNFYFKKYEIVMVLIYILLQYTCMVTKEILDLRDLMHCRYCICVW